MLTKEKKDLILVPFDFTEQSYTALDHASAIARQSEDEVRLIHIVNADTKSLLKKVNEDDTLKALEKIANENAAKSGIETTFYAEEGSIFSTIGEYADASSASLVVMGTHGVKGVQHIVGANSLRVVTSIAVPVIIVQRKKIDADGYKHILLPIDHYKKGKNKTAYAIAVAKYFNSNVHIFVSVESDEFTSNQIALNLSHAEKYLKENNITYTIEKEDPGKGAFSKQLVRYASLVDADLIVISSEHDSEGVMDFVIRNKEVQIINNDSQLAVMCVNPAQNITHLDIDSFNF